MRRTSTLCFIITSGLAFLSHGCVPEGQGSKIHADESSRLEPREPTADAGGTQTSAIKPAPVVGGLAIVATVEIQDGATGPFLKAVADVAAETRKEPGCLQYSVLKDPTKPNRFVIFELYADSAAQKAHGTAPYVANFFRDVKPLFASNPVIEPFIPVDPAAMGSKPDPLKINAP